MSFELNNEKATDVLIWWVEGSDGSIEYSEDKAVHEILESMSYSPETFYEDTVMHISGLGTENLKALIEEAISWAKENFSHHRKQQTLALLEKIAESSGSVSEEQQERIDRLQQEFGIESPRKSE